MPVIQVDDQRYALKPGQTRLGGGSGVDVPVAGADALGVQAIVELASNNQVVIRRATADSSVRVNGVLLGVEPTPLIHGDKVEIGGRELLFADDAKAGATQFVSGGELAALVQKRAGAGRATTATGGRLISLVDGKEYAIPAAGISIGRDAASGIVVPQTEVSRHHADVLPAENGYVVHDRSTNGVFVNGERIEGSRLLGRADVVRIGSEEFRFYADLAPVVPKTPTPPAGALPAKPAAPAPAKPAEPAAPAPVQPSQPPAMPTPTPEPAPVPRPAPTPSPVPQPPAPRAAAAAVDPRRVIATLEIVNEGIDKGKKFELRDPLVHVGRGGHNDVVVADDSVSETHAKLQRRDDGWYIVDLGSTNGTYVAGTRIAEERRIEGTPDLRFGGIKMSFRPAAAAAEEGKGTRLIASVPADRAKAREHTSPAPAPAPVSTPVASPDRGAARGISVWIWVVAVVAIAAVAYFLLRG